LFAISHDLHPAKVFLGINNGDVVFHRTSPRLEPLCQDFLTSPENSIELAPSLIAISHDLHPAKVFRGIMNGDVVLHKTSPRLEPIYHDILTSPENPIELAPSLFAIIH
jgi:hypothetical protein